MADATVEMLIEAFARPLTGATEDYDPFNLRDGGKATKSLRTPNPIREIYPSPCTIE